MQASGKEINSKYYGDPLSKASGTPKQTLGVRRGEYFKFQLGPQEI